MIAGRDRTAPHRTAIGLFLIVSMLACLCMNVGSASARHLVTHTLGSSFSDPYGSVASLGVDEEHGYVYVFNRAPGGPLEKFSATGTPLPFTAPEANSSTKINTGGNQSIRIDNSGNPATDGRIYVISGSDQVTGKFSNIRAFEPSGSEIKGKFPLETFRGFNDIAIEPGTGNIWAALDFGTGSQMVQYTPSGAPTGDEFFVDRDRTVHVEKFVMGAGGTFFALATKFDYSTFEDDYRSQLIKFTEANLNDEPIAEGSELALDPVTGDLYLQAGRIRQYGPSGSIVQEFGAVPGGEGRAVIAVNGNSERVYRGTEGKVEIYDPGPSIIIPDATTEPASDFSATGATLRGAIDPDGVPTSDCFFEWGVTSTYGHKTQCAEGAVLSGSGDQEVSLPLTGLTKGTTYHYRVGATNANGTITGLDETLSPSLPATFGEEHVSDVHSDSVVLHGAVNPEGAASQFHFEYGLADCASNPCMSSPAETAPLGTAGVSESFKATGLKDGTTYHYRLVAENQSGSSAGTDHTFTTFPLTALLEDPCGNAHVRQQTGAALLLDCRAYELVSAANAGGYDVESNVVPDDDPFGGYPQAVSPSRLLYAVHEGAIPGVGAPANLGLDTYVATRGEDGWSTDYVGIPSDNPYAGGPFSSGLLEATPSLEAFAYGGKGICSPCFGDGSTNIPLRLPDGSLRMGMTGSRNPGPANPAGQIGKYFSADGSHLVFGTTTQLEPAGNENGDASIYERDLEGGTTQVVSTLPDGSTMTGSGIAELDVSSDGSRVVIGRLISTDSHGNAYYHLYMHVGSDPDSVDLTPDTSSGVLYDGMTADGSSVYFTTMDPLATAVNQDTDTSADIFRSEVGSDSAQLTRVSTGSGGAGNTDSCTPPGNWNAPSGAGKCGALALAGGAGVAVGSGTFYFLSPEILDTSNPENLPVQDQPNLYVATPGGEPRFVATMDSSTLPSKPPPPPKLHPLANPAFAGSLSAPQTMDVDQEDGDLYVSAVGSGKIHRFDSSGAPKPFSAGSDPGTNTISFPLSGTESQIAVDSSGGLLNHDIYAVSYGALVTVFAEDGSQIGAINAGGGICGVAVDQTDGSVYVGDYSGHIYRYAPSSPTLPLSEADYTKTGIAATGMELCYVAADGAGHVFASRWENGPLKRYDVADFAESTPPEEGQLISANSRAIAVDPQTHRLYVDLGNAIAEYAPDGKSIATFGSGLIANSRGLAIRASDEHVFAANGSAVTEFGAVADPSYNPIDNPAIVHATTQVGKHTYGDFQVQPGGRFAAFDSTVSLTGFDNAGYSEVFRYDTENGDLVCASCNPTNARALGSSTLPSGGLGLSQDGKVFYDSEDPLAPRDLDGKVDAYEYAGGSPQLISTGLSPFDSRMLGIDESASDAYFFTRDTLVPQDENGDLVKVYDARVDGGFPYVPPEVPCKASDECHGPGTAIPPPPDIRTIRGTSGNESDTAKKRACKHGKVRKAGRCTKKPRHTKRKHKRRVRHDAHRHG